MSLTNTVKLLQQFAKNGVIRLTDVAGKNYPLFKFTLSNLHLVKESLQIVGLELFDDLHGKRGYEKVRLYLKYHFGDIVNLSEVRKSHRTVYNYIMELGKPYEVLTQMGFEIDYRVRDPEQELAKQVSNLGDGIIPPKLYQKLYYRARRSNMSVKEYIKLLQSQYEG